MKRTGFSNYSKNIFFGFMLAEMIFLFASCARKITFLNSSVVPAAQGYVEVKKDKNKNNAIQVRLSNLADVGRLVPPQKTYVVWMVTDDEVTKNIGLIKSSKKLNVDFETTSPFKPIKIFITAEDDGSIQYPSTQVVLTTSRF